ncbi:transposon Ty3-I Gag-Pol polyprotein [Trichonephila clavipes]|nr:transposon Ty3-I Gag-Pol polyprotein [Trichonephila clavipes]
MHTQRFINEILFGLEFVFPYLEDILVASENEEQHKTHLKLVFDRLQKYGLRVNISKSTLGVTHLEFLGYLITPEGSKPLPEKVDAILSYKLPETIRDCQKNKINRYTHSQIGTFGEVDDRFSVIHVDIIDPFPVSEGKINCLTFCIDHFTCWIEVIPLSNVTAETVAREFYNHWISRFEMPYRVITDQGTQFRSELFKNIGVICGFKVSTTTSYHPQCNGKIEKIHRTLNAVIRAHNSVKWTLTLPTVLLGLRSSLRSDTNYTIAQMVYGQTIRLPAEFSERPKNVLDTDTFAKELQKQMDQLQPLKTRRQPSQKHFVHKDLHNSTHVFIHVDRVKKALEPP